MNGDELEKLAAYIDAELLKITGKPLGFVLLTVPFEESGTSESRWIGNCDLASCAKICYEVGDSISEQIEA